MTVRRRLVALLLVALSILTLAPRTSVHLPDGWEAFVVSDTSAQAKRVSTLTFWAVPPDPVPAASRIAVFVSGDDWRLVRAPQGCTTQTGAVVCVVNREELRRKHLITLSVRSAGPVSFGFEPPGPTVP